MELENINGNVRIKYKMKIIIYFCLYLIYKIYNFKVDIFIYYYVIRF